MNIHRIVEMIFDPFWNWFYSIRSNREKFEYGCFPFPFKINCLGCHGCCHNRNPLLSPPKPKGPYKVYTTEMFNRQYRELCGDSALVQLLFELEKHNEQIDEQKEANYNEC